MPKQVVALLHLLRGADRRFAELAVIVERVGPYQRKTKEKQIFAGIKSNFLFGHSVGVLHAMLEMTFGRGGWNLVGSPVWMKRMDCLTRGNKQVTLDKARSIWPEFKGLTKQNADAACLGAYGLAELNQHGWTKCAS